MATEHHHANSFLGQPADSEPMDQLSGRRLALLTAGKRHGQLGANCPDHLELKDSSRSAGNSCEAKSGNIVRPQIIPIG
jgi:hypothetical protein